MLPTTLTKVNDRDFTLSLSLVVMLIWHDPRLEFLPTNSTIFPVDTALAEKIWVPDIEIGPIKSIARKQSFQGYRPGIFDHGSLFALKSSLILCQSRIM